MRDGSKTTGRIEAPIRKIPPELRRKFNQWKKIEVPATDSAVRRVYATLKKFYARMSEDSQFTRTGVQAAFILLCIWIGIEFHLFVKWGLSGGESMYVPRPPGVEAFLPISSLMSLSYWVQTGNFNQIHPSGLLIFLAILVTGFFMKKAFCSWVCPVGALSESLWMLGKKIFKGNLKVPRWLDYPLRSLKYLLLFFFLWAILQMDSAALANFIFSPYNKMADVKMYLFFADITTFSLWVIIILMLASVVIKNFWCRFLCPYGALLGMASFLSPLKITRNASTCNDCALCTKACPHTINVHTAKRVLSDECTACLRCTAVCPVKDCLQLKATKRSKPVPSFVFGTLVVGVFLASMLMGLLFDRWHNSISDQEYLRRFKEINSPLYLHNQGNVPDYGPGD